VMKERKTPACQENAKQLMPRISIRNPVTCGFQWVDETDCATRKGYTGKNLIKNQFDRSRLQWWWCGIDREKDSSCHQGAIKLTHKTGIECSEMNGLGIFLEVCTFSKCLLSFLKLNILISLESSSNIKVLIQW